MYNIPMALWIPRAYPREPPVAYVTPTSDMLVRKGVNVDVSGRVGGVYLQQWERKWEVRGMPGGGGLENSKCASEQKKKRAH